jgi:hypothetical protein
MPLTHREGLVMYWCEGDRSQESRTYRTALTSCDAKILTLFVQWLEQYYGINKLELKVRLHLWPDSDEKAAKRYWAEQLGVPLNSFTKSWTKPRGKGTGKRIHNYGICRVSVSSKELLQRIISEIEREFEC